MKKYRILILLLITLQSTFVFGQVPVNFNDCEYDMFFISAETNPSWKVDSITKVDYFNNYLADNNELKGVTGKIILGILVFELGKTCCHSFFDMTNSKLKPEIFKNAVNKMPDWEPAKQKGKNIIFLFNLVLNIKNGKFIDEK